MVIQFNFLSNLSYELTEHEAAVGTQILGELHRYYVRGQLVPSHPIIAAVVPQNPNLLQFQNPNLLQFRAVVVQSSASYPEDHLGIATFRAQYWDPASCSFRTDHPLVFHHEVGNLFRLRGSGIGVLIEIAEDQV